MRKLKSFLAIAVGLVGFGSSMCCAQHIDRENRQSGIPVPRVSDFDSRFDIPKNEVIAWMDALQARMETLKYDCRIKADVSSINEKNDHTSVFIGWSVALRCAKNPSEEAERYITVRQYPLDNLAIATGEGVAEDKRIHYDVLRLGGKIFSSNVTAFDYHVSEITSEVDSKLLGSILNYLYVFNPIRACTSSVTMVRDGHALEIGQHSVLPQTVRAVLRDGEFVHVLLELRVSNSTSKVPLLYTFKDQVPVQVMQWDKVDNKSGRPIPTFLTRSSWKAVKEGKVEQLLPYVIKGQVNKPYVIADMEIFVEWDLANDVDGRLFVLDSLGKLPPASDVVFDLPNKIEEMVEGVFDGGIDKEQPR